MLYLYYGSDKEKIREKARALFESLRIKKPEASFGEIGSDEVTKEKLDELVGGSGLFENKCVIFMKDIFSDKNTREIAEEYINEIAESPNIFIITETALTKVLLSKLQKKAEKTQELEQKEKVSETKPENFFSIADAFGRRDEKVFWLKINEALTNGAQAEELHGIIFWQVKAMILSFKSKNASEAGLNPYVFSKSKEFAKNFKEEELYKITENLVNIYHEAHRGRCDFNTALEKFALSI